jgi:hypothetical protein
MVETSGWFRSGLVEAMRKKMLVLSVIAATTPRTPTESETTFQRACVHGNACAGRRVVVVFAPHHGKSCAKSIDTVKYCKPLLLMVNPILRNRKSVTLQGIGWQWQSAVATMIDGDLEGCGPSQPPVDRCQYRFTATTERSPPGNRLAICSIRTSVQSSILAD